MGMINGSSIRRATALLSLLFIALTLGLTFAHVLELVGKQRLGRARLVDRAAESLRCVRPDRSSV
jgi:hypothetical protein